MLNIKDALAAHAECDRKVILTEMFFFAYFRDIVCYHIVPSILIISGNHFREMVLSRGRRKTGSQTLSLLYSISCPINRTISIILGEASFRFAYEFEVLEIYRHFLILKL